ncbi:threonine synthase [Alkalibacter mobilis]|uniref:threonine synthase n=1 Tax=Alkalibacter mobilis TaxID=2787712 RepID=UPI00189E8AB0|nr:threonine synthase [Alkalibacter mobilis]MBF7097051.1 threonine synthase [Alkalibacter mobilis]
MFKYVSTRSGLQVSPSEAILKGIASDGGLFVPSEFPKIDIRSLENSTYNEICLKVLTSYFYDFDENDLKNYIESAYSKFNTPEVTPVKSFENLNFLELYHGPTLAFKDVALSILPYLLTGAAKIQKITDEIVILTATSGDTGKAALEGFSDVKGTRIVVFFPNNGVSQIQRKQMTTQKGDNVHVVAIEGNFDDAQNGVKNIFNDKNFNSELETMGYVLSSANSINVGRLVPQIVYYFVSYINSVKNGIIKMGDPMNYTVPTGNFGNILAGYYAKQMGLPVNKLICASNENNVLYDFFSTGVYDKNRPFIKTTSPSMDILISSNFERLLYHVSGSDNDFVKNSMESLISDGKYSVPSKMKENIDKEFYGGFCSETETENSIKEIYEKFGYVMDTHTAVGYKVYKDYVENAKDNTPNIILSTASPYKFTKSVYESIFGESDLDDYELIAELSKKAGIPLPNDLIEMCKSKDVHDTFCEKEDMKDLLRGLLK